jgi:hypothetical protein
MESTCYNRSDYVFILSNIGGGPYQRGGHLALALAPMFRVLGSLNPGLSMGFNQIKYNM